MDILKEKNKKKEAATRISFFIQALFTISNSIEVALVVTKKGEICIIDNQTGYQKKYNSADFNKEYISWLTPKEKQN